MGLVGVPGSARHVGRGHAPGQQLDRPLGPADLPDGASGQPRRPRHPSFHRARGQTLDVTLQGRRRDRVVHQQTGANEPVDEDIGVVRPREFPCRPVEPERRVRHLRQRQRPVDQLSRRQTRHERAEAELDAEELGVLQGSARSSPSSRALAPSAEPRPAAGVTTISQWLAATEMKDSSGSLRVCHVSSTKGERDGRRSIVNSSTARFMTVSMGRGSETHRWRPRARRRIGPAGISDLGPATPARCDGHPIGAGQGHLGSRSRRVATKSSHTSWFERCPPRTHSGT